MFYNLTFNIPEKAKGNRTFPTNAAEQKKMTHANNACSFLPFRGNLLVRLKSKLFLSFSVSSNLCAGCHCSAITMQFFKTYI